VGQTCTVLEKSKHDLILKGKTLGMIGIRETSHSWQSCSFHHTIAYFATIDQCIEDPAVPFLLYTTPI
jgi:hypothetical protein